MLFCSTPCLLSHVGGYIPGIWPCAHTHNESSKLKGFRAVKKMSLRTGSAPSAHDSLVVSNCYKSCACKSICIYDSRPRSSGFKMLFHGKGQETAERSHLGRTSLSTTVEGSMGFPSPLKIEYISKYTSFILNIHFIYIRIYF